MKLFANKVVCLQLLLTCFTFSIYSQEYRIQGKVLTTENEPIWLANVLLLSALDSILIDGSSSDEYGIFKLNDVPPGDYLISASYLENQSEYLRINVDGDINIGSLTISNYAQTLQEVVVTTQRPRVERKVDRLVFNVENTALSDGDIWEALKGAPGVVVINNQLSVKGNKDIGILINGRKVNLPRADIINLLSGTTASNVESIEVITNPPVKYSAEDGILINIKMKKNLIAGYNGAIYNRYTQGIFPKHTFGTDHYFKGNKFGFSANYSFGKEKWFTQYTDITNYIDDGTITSTWTANEDYIRKRKWHTFNAFFDYDFNDRNSLSISTLNQWNPSIGRVYDTSTKINDQAGSLQSGFNTTNVSDEGKLNASVHLDYVHKLPKKGAELSVNSHFTYYDYERDQNLENDFFNIDGNLTDEYDFTTLSTQRINLFSLQTDYFTPVGKNSKFETGLRFAGIHSESIIEQVGIDRNQLGINPTERGLFDYDENIFASYLSVDNKWNKWKMKAGLRAEYTKSRANSNVANKVDNDSYFKLFPSFSVQYTPHQKHDFNLYYYRRITRPRYDNVNPFQVFQSYNSVVEGNPELLPSSRHYIAAGYTMNNNYTFEVFYKNRTNRNLKLVFQDNQNQLLRFISSNVDKDYAYGFNISVSKNITNNWYFYFLASTSYIESNFTDLDSGQLVENGLWNTYIRSNSSFSFLNDNSLKADVSYLFSSPVIQGNSRQEEYSRLGIALQKTIWNKKGSISLGIDDVFNKAKLFNTRNYLNQNNTSFYRPESRLVVLGFRYKFGNTKIRSNKKSKKVEERNRI